MFRKANGYNATVTRAIKVRRVEYDDLGHKIREWEDIVQAEETIHIPADTTAQIFWLKNRRSDDWRDKREAPPEPMKEAPYDGFLEALKGKA